MIPKISVLVPVYNAAPYLNIAIESILSQSFLEFELLIINDGSRDRSNEIAVAYENDIRVKVRSRENRGLVATRNELLDWAQCELIVWMDADDVSEKDRLKTQYEFIVNNKNLVCVGTSVQCIDPTGNFLNIERYPNGHLEILACQMLGGGIRFATTIMRKSIAIGVGGFRGDFRMGEDLDLLIRMGEQGELANIQSVLYFYRQHLKSTVATLGSNWVACRSIIIELAKERQKDGIDRLQRGESVGIDWAARGVTAMGVSATYGRWALHCYNNENYRVSIRYAFLSLIRYPFSLRIWAILVFSLVMFLFKKIKLRI